MNGVNKRGPRSKKPSSKEESKTRGQEESVKNLTHLSAEHIESLDEKEFSGGLQKQYSASNPESRTQLRDTIIDLCNPKPQTISTQQETDLSQQESTVHLIDQRTSFMRTVVAHNVSKTLEQIVDNKDPTTFTNDLVKEMGSKQNLGLGMEQLTKIQINDDSLLKRLQKWGMEETHSDDNTKIVAWLTDLKDLDPINIGAIPERAPLFKLFNTDTCNSIKALLQPKETSSTAATESSSSATLELPTPAKKEAAPQIVTMATPSKITNELLTFIEQSADTYNVLPNGLYLSKDEGLITVQRAVATKSEAPESKVTGHMEQIGSINADQPLKYDTATNKLHFKTTEGQDAFIQLETNAEGTEFTDAMNYNAIPATERSNISKDIEEQRPVLQALLNCTTAQDGDRAFTIPLDDGNTLRFDGTKITYTKGRQEIKITQKVEHLGVKEGGTPLTASDIKIDLWYPNDGKTELLSLDFSHIAETPGTIQINTQSVNADLPSEPNPITVKCLEIECTNSTSAEITDVLGGNLAAISDLSTKAANQALQACAESGSQGPIEPLIANSADIEATNSTGDTALHLACMSGKHSLDSVLEYMQVHSDKKPLKDEEVSETGHDILNALQLDTETAITFRGKQFLVSRDSVQEEEDPSTRLSFKSAVKTLIKKKADITKRNLVGQTALHIALEGEAPGPALLLAKMLIESAEADTPDGLKELCTTPGGNNNNLSRLFRMAVEANDTEIINHCLETNSLNVSDINSDTGQNVVHTLVKKNMPELLKRLQTSLQEKNKQLVKDLPAEQTLLLQNAHKVEWGNALRTTDYEGNSPVHYDLKMAGANIDTLLNSKMVNPNTKSMINKGQDDEGNTPLHLALNIDDPTRRAKITDRLLTGLDEHDIENLLLGQPNNSDETVLQLAVEKNPQLALSLLDKLPIKPIRIGQLSVALHTTKAENKALKAKLVEKGADRKMADILSALNVNGEEPEKQLTVLKERCDGLDSLSIDTANSELVISKDRFSTKAIQVIAMLTQSEKKKSLQLGNYVLTLTPGTDGEKPRIDIKTVDELRKEAEAATTTAAAAAATQSASAGHALDPDPGEGTTTTQEKPAPIREALELESEASESETADAASLLERGLSALPTLTKEGNDLILTPDDNFELYGKTITPEELAEIIESKEHAKTLEDPVTPSIMDMFSQTVNKFRRANYNLDIKNPSKDPIIIEDGPLAGTYAVDRTTVTYVGPVPQKPDTLTPEQRIKLNEARKQLGNNGNKLEMNIHEKFTFMGKSIEDDQLKPLQSALETLDKINTFWRRNHPKLQKINKTLKAEKQLLSKMGGTNRKIEKGIQALEEQIKKLEDGEDGIKARLAEAKEALAPFNITLGIPSMSKRGYPLKLDKK